MNPPYEMGFNARINRARCYEAGGKGSDEVRNELAKLQKDPKNKDFLDQIYYALAGLEKKSGNEPGEIEYLNKSVQASTTNKNQKRFPTSSSRRSRSSSPTIDWPKDITTVPSPTCPTTIRTTRKSCSAGTVLPVWCVT